MAGLVRRGYTTSNNHLDEENVPKMHEVLIGDSSWDTEHEGHRSGKQSIAAHRMNACYQWNTIMVSRSLIIYPD
jgi:hypothetical protein